uniref:Uncharacterized protein n=1 Tax=Molossus molossus TaxID=27622 RepID=A0A7J8E300_MOLMO|nr:hypothetical protein HJG59_009060 [Molossus molossus]
MFSSFFLHWNESLRIIHASPLFYLLSPQLSKIPLIPPIECLKFFPFLRLLPRLEFSPVISACNTLLIIIPMLSFFSSPVDCRIKFRCPNKTYCGLAQFYLHSTVFIFMHSLFYLKQICLF